MSGSPLEPIAGHPRLYSPPLTRDHAAGPAGTTLLPVRPGPADRHQPYAKAATTAFPVPARGPRGGAVCLSARSLRAVRGVAPALASLWRAVPSRSRRRVPRRQGWWGAARVTGRERGFCAGLACRRKRVAGVVHVVFAVRDGGSRGGAVGVGGGSLRAVRGVAPALASLWRAVPSRSRRRVPRRQGGWEAARVTGRERGCVVMAGRTAAPAARSGPCRCLVTARAAMITETRITTEIKCAIRARSFRDNRNFRDHVRIGEPPQPRQPRMHLPPRRPAKAARPTGPGNTR